MEKLEKSALPRVEFDSLVDHFHKQRHEDKGFNAFYRSTDFGLWVADMIKSGEIIALWDK
jgi:hypothetical protein